MGKCRYGLFPTFFPLITYSMLHQWTPKYCILIFRDRKSKDRKIVVEQLFLCRDPHTQAVGQMGSADT